MIEDKGLLVPNLFVNSDILEKYGTRDKNKIIFDGYPRTLNQAVNLDNLLNKFDQKINLVLKLSVPSHIIE